MCNKKILLESFFNLKIDHSKDLDDNLDIFNNLVQNITDCGEKLYDEYKDIILLNAIFDSYKEIKNVIKYGKNMQSDFTSNIVIDSLKRKEIEMKGERDNRKIEKIHQMMGRSHFRGRKEQNDND